MKVSELRDKSASELKLELVRLWKEQFSLKMRKSTGQLSQTHLMKDIRKNIARVKTILGEKAGG